MKTKPLKSKSKVGSVKPIKIKHRLVASNPVPKDGPQIVKRTKGSRAIDSSAGKAKLVPKRVADLRANSKNPRYITASQLKKLKTSIETFGDLSGIVFNVATGSLVSGHQRITSIKGKKSKLVRTPTKDKVGTVALGYVEVTEKDGNVTKIPYREVNWRDNLHEYAALIGANAHGGDFDTVKLGRLMTKLTEAQFEIELTGVGELDFQKSLIKFRNDSNSTAPDVEGETSGGRSFKEVSPSDMKETNHKCPRCGMKFD